MRSCFPRAIPKYILIASAKRGGITPLQSHAQQLTAQKHTDLTKMSHVRHLRIKLTALMSKNLPLFYTISGTWLSGVRGPSLCPLHGGSNQFQNTPVAQKTRNQCCNSTPQNVPFMYSQLQSRSVPVGGFLRDKACRILRYDKRNIQYYGYCKMAERMEIFFLKFLTYIHRCPLGNDTLYSACGYTHFEQTHHFHRQGRNIKRFFRNAGTQIQ